MLRNGTAMVELRAIDPAVPPQGASPHRRGRPRQQQFRPTCGGGTRRTAPAAAAPLAAPRPTIVPAAEAAAPAPSAAAGGPTGVVRAGRRIFGSRQRAGNAWPRDCVEAAMARSSCATIRLPDAECTACASVPVPRCRGVRPRGRRSGKGRHQRCSSRAGLASAPLRPCDNPRLSFTYQGIHRLCFVPCWPALPLPHSRPFTALPRRPPRPRPPLRR